MSRKTDSDKVHYDASTPVLQLKKNGGRGACGEVGIVSGYAAAVTCKACYAIAEGDLKTLHNMAKGDYNGHKSK